MSDILRFLQGLTPSDIGTLLTLLGSGVGVSVVLAIIRHFGHLQDARKLTVSLLGLLGFLGGLADSLIQFGTLNPSLAASKYLSWVIVVAIAFHEFIGSSAYHSIVNWLNRFAADAADAAAYRQEHAVPAVDPALAAAAVAAAPIVESEFTLPQQS